MKAKGGVKLTALRDGQSRLTTAYGRSTFSFVVICCTLPKP